MTILDLYLHQTAEIAGKEGRDLYGKPVVGAPVTVKCRFQEVTATMKNQNGEVIGVDAEFWLNNDININIGDQMTVDGSKYRVVKASKKVGLDGTIDHIKGLAVLIQ